MGVSDAPTMSATVNETLQGACDVHSSNRIVFSVAQLLGTKTLLNEFIAYQRLSPKIDCCELSVSHQLLSTLNGNICAAARADDGYVRTVQL